MSEAHDISGTSSHPIGGEAKLPLEPIAPKSIIDGTVEGVANDKLPIQSEHHPASLQGRAAQPTQMEETLNQLNKAKLPRLPDFIKTKPLPKAPTAKKTENLASSEIKTKLETLKSFFSTLSKIPSALKSLVIFKKESPSAGKKAFESIDSTKLTSISKNIKNRDDVLKAKSYKTDPPHTARANFVPRNLVEYGEKNKRDTSIDRKHFAGAKISNIMGVMMMFKTQVAKVTLFGIPFYGRGHEIAKFESGKGLPVVLSTAIQPDLQDENVFMKLMKPGEEGIRGEMLPANFKILDEIHKEIHAQLKNETFISHPEVPADKVKSYEEGLVYLEELFQKSNGPEDVARGLKNAFMNLNGKIVSLSDYYDKFSEQLKDPLENHEQQLLKHMIYHLTDDHGLPSVNDDNSFGIESGKAKLEDLIKKGKSHEEILSELKGKFIIVEGHTLSLEILYKTYLVQLKNEFTVLENECPQGYVYTIDPPSEFLKVFGNNKAAAAEICNRMQILAFKSMNQESPLTNCKRIGFNDYLDHDAIQLFQIALPKMHVQSKNSLFNSKHEYVGPKGNVLVLHNNSDAFGDNIRTEDQSYSLDGNIGTNSDAAKVFSAKNKDAFKNMHEVHS